MMRSILIMLAFVPAIAVGAESLSSSEVLNSVYYGNNQTMVSPMSVGISPVEHLPVIMHGTSCPSAYITGDVGIADSSMRNTGAIGPKVDSKIGTVGVVVPWSWGCKDKQDELHNLYLNTASRETSMAMIESCEKVINQLETSFAHMRPSRAMFGRGGFYEEFDYCWPAVDGRYDYFAKQIALKQAEERRRADREQNMRHSVNLISK